MENLKNSSFTRNVPISGNTVEVAITPAETTDGIAFYICTIGDKEIAQIRKDEQEWKQLWGDLPESDIAAMGHAIEAAIPNE